MHFDKKTEVRFVIIDCPKVFSISDEELLNSISILCLYMNTQRNACHNILDIVTT